MNTPVRTLSHHAVSVAACICYAGPAIAGDVPRERLLIDDNWQLKQPHIITEDKGSGETRGIYLGDSAELNAKGYGRDASWPKWWPDFVARPILSGIFPWTGFDCRTNLAADGQDVAVVNVRITDDMGRFVPSADNLVEFSLNGLKSKLNFKL